MIHTGIYDGHTPGPWKVDDRIKEMFTQREWVELVELVKRGKEE